MPSKSEFRVLVATDGSPPAQAALEVALAFPWPDPSNARAIVAVGGMAPMKRRLRAEAMRSLLDQVDAAQHALARRWEGADAVARHAAPAEAILAEARRYGARAIVMGWRGHGSLRRLLAGSVSRTVVAGARAPVLIVRTPGLPVRRLVIGYDGSPGAKAAVDYVGELEPRVQVQLTTIVEPRSLPPSARRLPASIRANLSAEVAGANHELEKAARRRAEAAATALARKGWRVKTEIRFAAPLEGLLQAAGARSEVLVVGARRSRRGLTGSVASGALNHSRVPVLIVP